MGCEVEWNNAENTWDCPCHGSRYTYTGDILNGPAVQPLKKLDYDRYIQYYLVVISIQFDIIKLDKNRQISLGRY